MLPSTSLHSSDSSARAPSHPSSFRPSRNLRGCRSPSVFQNGARGNAAFHHVIHFFVLFGIGRSELQTRRLGIIAWPRHQRRIAFSISN